MTPLKGINIRTAIHDDEEDILYGFRTYYWPYEPLSSGYKIKTASPLEQAFFMSIPKKGMSLVATNVDQGDKICGFLTIDIFTPNSIREFDEFAREFGKDERMESMKAIYLKLDEQCNVFNKYKVDKCMMLVNLAVDSSMRGKSIGQRLFMEGYEVAKEKECKIVVADCTGFYSQQIAQRLGMDCVAEVLYKDHVDETGKPIFNPPDAKHTCMRRYVKVLRLT